jgi:hypothetical protein
MPARETVLALYRDLLRESAALRVSLQDKHVRSDSNARRSFNFVLADTLRLAITFVKEYVGGFASPFQRQKHVVGPCSDTKRHAPSRSKEGHAGDSAPSSFFDISEMQTRVTSMP